MENEKTISLLNNLIEINNDRIEGYKTAIEETDEADLISIFTQFKQSSEKCKSELTSEVMRLGGEPREGTRVTGKFFRVWMDVKAALTGKDRKTILSSCEYGEEVAQNNYEDTLNDSPTDLSFEQQNMLKSQLELLRADYNTVRRLGEVMA